MYLKNDLGAFNAPDLSALNIQEVADINTRVDMARMLSSNQISVDDNPAIYNSVDKEIQENLLMNPMHNLSLNGFIAMAKEIETNKVLEVQLSQINKVHKINGINQKKVLQNQFSEAKNPD